MSSHKNTCKKCGESFYAESNLVVCDPCRGRTNKCACGNAITVSTGRHRKCLMCEVADADLTFHDDVEEWYEKAACLGADVNVFYPEKEAVGTVRRVAKLWCDQCPVQVQCLEEALKLGAEYDNYDAGIIGGTSGADRRRIRAERASRGLAA